MPFSPDFLMSQIKGGQSLKTDSFKQAQDMVKTDVLGDYAAAVSASDQEYNLQELNLSKNLNSLLSTGAGLESYINDTPFTEKVGKILSEPGSLSPFGSMNDIGIKISHLPNLSKYERVIASVYLYQDVINKFSYKEIDKALKDLRTTFQKTFSKLNPDGRDELARSYKQIVNFANAKAKIKMATEDLDAYLANVDFGTRKTQLDKYNPNKESLSYKIADPNKTKEDTRNALADLESNIYGSKVYNEEDLFVFKNNPNNSRDNDLYSKFDLEIAYAKQSAVRQKVGQFQQELNQIDGKINKATSQEEKNLLAQQKLNLKQEVDYLKSLDQKLNNESNPDIYLKNFYPDLYAKEKHRQTLEAIKNKNYATGDEIQWFGENGVFYRGSQAIAKNTVNTISGIQHLAGFHLAGYNTKSLGDELAPPTLFVGNDINKNNIIDPNEIQKDIYGENLTFDQFRFKYKDKNGKLVDTWNLQVPIESTLPIALDVATTVLLTRGAGSLARAGGLTYGNIGKTVAGVKGAATLESMAPAIATFGGTFTTTFPRFYAEERAFFKDSGDALNTALLRAGVEALSETITPDAAFFRDKGVTNMLDRFIDPALNTLAGKFGGIDALRKLSLKADQLLALVPPNSLSALDAFKVVAPYAIRKTLSSAAQESIEELASLVGNHFIDEYVAKPNNFEFEGQNDLTMNNVVDTLVEGFIPSLFISGVQTNTPIRGNVYGKDGQALKDEFGNNYKKWYYSPLVQKTEQARWNVANNPEMYKQHLARERAAGKITPEQEVRQVAEVQKLANKFKQMLPELDNIRDIFGLAVDREAQYRYFNNLLHEEELLSTDTSEYTEDQLKEFEKLTVQVTDEVLDTRSRISQYKKMTLQEKEANLKAVYEAKKKDFEKADMGTALHTLHTLNPLLARLNTKDKAVGVAFELFKDYYNFGVNDITTRISNFEQVLSTNPEALTNLELLNMLEIYGPIMDSIPELQTVATQQTASTEIPFVNAGTLYGRIKQEYTNRSVYESEDAFVDAAAKNLKNAELGKVQAERFGLAQLSDEELETGVVNPANHPNLSSAELFSLSLSLKKNEEHKKRSGKNKLKTRVETLRKNDYTFAKNQDGSFDLNKIRQANEKAKQASENVTNNTTTNKKPQPAVPIVPPPVNNAPVVPPAITVNNPPAPNLPPVNPDEVSGVVTENIAQVNPELYEKYVQIRAAFDAQLNNPNIDPETKKEEIAQFNSLILEDILDTTNLVDAFTILAAAFPGKEIPFSKFFVQASKGNVDSSLLQGLGLSNLYIKRLIPHVENIVKTNGVVDPVSTDTEEVIEEEEDLFNDNSEVNEETNNIDTSVIPTENKSNKVVLELSEESVLAQQRLTLELVDNDFSLSLAMTNVNQNNQSLMDDPYVSFSHKVLNVFKNQNRKGAAPNYKMLITSLTNLYSRILPDESLAALAELKSKKGPLNAQDQATLRSILSIEGMPLQNESAINYYINKPSTIGDGVLSLIVDANLQPVYFDKNGREVTTNGTPLMLTLKTNKHISINAAEEQLRAVAERVSSSGGYIVTDIVGISSPKSVPVEKFGKYEIYVHNNPNAETLQTEFGEFTLQPGYSYVKDEKDVHLYQYLQLAKVDPELLIAIVDAFNNGTLPDNFPDDLKQDPIAFIKYLEDHMFFSSKQQGLVFAYNKSNKIVFKSKDATGKYTQLRRTTRNNTIRNKMSNLRYSVNAQRLSDNQEFNLLVLKGGELQSINFPTYEAMVRSKEYGAKVITRANESFALSPDLTIYTNSNIVEQGNEDVLPPTPPLPEISSETTTNVTDTSIQDKKAAIERRRREELASVFQPIPIESIDEKGNVVSTTDKTVAINARYDAELARELYKEIKAGKTITEMTPAEQKVANTYITEELKKSVDAELAALEQSTVPTQSSQQPVTATPTEKGRKQINKAFEELRDEKDENGNVIKTKTPEEKLNAINKIERNVSEGAVLTKAESMEVRRTKDTLASEGYEVGELLGKKFSPTLNIILVSSIPDEDGTLAEGEEVITKVLKPAIFKDGKMVQTAQIEVTVGTKKGGLSRNEWLKEQEQKKQQKKDSAETVVSQQPAQLNLFKDQPRLTPEQVAEREAKEQEDMRRSREEALQDAIAEEQLYMEYLADKEVFDAQEYTPIVQALDEMKILRKSFTDASDKGKLVGKQTNSKGYFAPDGFDIDAVAQYATELNGGTPITPDDIIDFIDQYPGGIGGPTSKSMNTYFGSFNPDANPKYNSIRKLIKDRKKAAKKAEIESQQIENNQDPWSSFGNIDDINDPFASSGLDNEDPFAFRVLTLVNEISDEQDAAAEAWFNSHPIFKNTKVIFNRTIAHPLAYAMWSANAITLYKGSNYAELYHEAWHEFSQMYLTNAQRDSLYAEARKIYGDLSLTELEEKIAEDFRSFALSNGTVMPEAIQQSQESKSIFQKIWDFLTAFFQNKQTIDKYFRQLYNGQIDSYVRDNQRGYFKRLYSAKLGLTHPDGTLKLFNFKDTDKMMRQLDSLFVAKATELAETYGMSFVNVLENKQALKQVFSLMFQKIQSDFKLYKQKNEEKSTPATLRKLNYLGLMYTNANSLFTFYQKNSNLFNDKIKKIALEDTLQEIEQSEGNSEFARFEAGINEQSQKDTAHPLVISAIKSLPQYKNRRPVKDSVFGVNVVGDFDKNWNILQRGLQGSNSYEEFYSRLQTIAKNYPQFKSLLPYLPKPNARNLKQSTLNFKTAFYGTFSMPYVEGYITEINRITDESGEDSIDFRLYKAQTSDAGNLAKSWDNQFATNPGLFKAVDLNTGSYYLDLNKLFEVYPKPLQRRVDIPRDEATKLYVDQLIPFLENIGIVFSDLGKQNLYQIPLEDLVKSFNYVYSKLQSIQKSGSSENIYRPLETLLSAHIDEEGKEVKSEISSVYRFINAEVNANLEFVNDMRVNVLNKKVWSVNAHTYMSRIVSALNDAVNYPTIDELFAAYPELNPKYNKGGSGSFVLTYLFDVKGARFKNPDGSYRSIELANLLGIKANNEGVKTVDSTSALKHFAEIEGFLSKGVEEINRLSGKSTTRTLVLPETLRASLGFKESFGSNNRIVFPNLVLAKLILPNILSEVLLAKELQENPNPYFKHSGFENGVPTLTYFQDIYKPATRQKLFDAFKNVTHATLIDAYNNLDPALKQDINLELQDYLLTQVRRSKTILQDAYTVDNYELIKYHTFSLFSRIEQHKLFFGHPYYYKTPKDIEKRLSAWNAYGTYAMLDEQNIENARHGAFKQREAFYTHNEELGNNKVTLNTEVDQDITKINYIVLKDNPIYSETAKNSDAYKTIVKDPKTEKEVELGSYYNDAKAKKQDAAAFTTLDFYARFYSLSPGGISEDMQKEFDRQNRIYDLYLKSLRGLPVQAELEKVLNEGPHYLFTIKKLQYAGRNLKDNEVLPVFHKYSVKPILPSEIINDPALGDILEKLHASAADYAVFESGTKIAETVQPISLYDKDGAIDKSYVPNSVGQIDMKYLKEQVLVENKEAFMSIFSTQFRKLLFKDSSPEQEELYNAYKTAIENLVDFDKIKFLDQIQDQEKLVNFIIQELSKKNISEATKDSIQLTEDGQLKHTLDAFVDRTIMESTMVAALKNAIIKQKVPGAQRVQYPVSLIRPSTTLRYYDLEDGKVRKAEAIVSFSKGYFPLLKLIYNNKPIGEFDSDGKPINLFTAIQTLNKALKDPIFRKRNEEVLSKALTMVAIRVPGQDYNSMESFEIVEFLPMESGEIILVPDEMVIKSGSDYDIDKLFCYDPFLEDDGSFRTNGLSPQEAFELQESLKAELLENKQVLAETIHQRNSLAKEVSDIIAKYGFDPAVTRLKDLYKMLKGIEAQNVEEESDGEITAEQLNAKLLEMKDVLEGRAARPETKASKKSQELNNQIKNIRGALKEAFDEDLSKDLATLNENIYNLFKRNKEITAELKAIRGRFTNSLFATIAERLESPEIFVKLLRPNSADIIKRLAEEYQPEKRATVEVEGQPKKKYSEQRDATSASYTNIVNPIYQLYVHLLNSFKKSLGVDAKMNVLHAILQKANLRVINTAAVEAYPLRANGLDRGIINLSAVYSVDGTRIGDVNGQLISAHVDIEKEDDIARIYLNNVVTPIANYMLLAGSEFSEIVKFINLPYFVNGQRQTPTIVKYAQGHALYSQSEYVKFLLEQIYERESDNTSKDNDYTNTPIFELLQKSINNFGEVSEAKLKEEVAKIITENPDIVLNDQTAFGDLIRFASFLSVKDQQQQLLTLSSNTDFDTFSPVNFESFRKGANDLRDLIKSNFFNSDGVRKVIQESVVSPFQIQQEIFDTFENIFPISASSKVATFITTAYSIMKKQNYALDYDQFSRIFKNDLLFALFRNNNPELNDYERLLDKKNPGNLAFLYQNLKSRLMQRGVSAENLIFDGVTFTTDENSSYIRAGFLSTDSEASINYFKEDFEQGLNWAHPDLDPTNEADLQLQQDMQSFFLAYAYAGILGTQLNKKFDSYLPYIPEHIYTSKMTSIINQFKESIIEEAEELANLIYENILNTSDNKKITDKLKAFTPSSDAERREALESVLDADLDSLLITKGGFLADFFQRFKDNHPELLRKFKDVNPSLVYFKDYDLTRTSMTPTYTVERIAKEVQVAISLFTPENITELGPNQVFVFGANTVGHHGFGAAGQAMTGDGRRPNYDVLEIGTKGKWAEYGVVNKLMEGTEGKSFGIVTKGAVIQEIDGEKRVKIGSKRSVKLSVVEESIVAMLESARQNPNYQYLVTEIGLKNAGWSVNEIRSLLAKHRDEIPSNVYFPKKLEVRNSTIITDMQIIADELNIPLESENFDTIKKAAIEESFSNLAKLNQEHQNYCKGNS